MLTTAVLAATLAFQSAGAARPPAQGQSAQHREDDDDERRERIAKEFDKSKSVYMFVETDTGGHVAVRSNINLGAEGRDPTVALLMQSHLKEIQQAFIDGNFDKPFFPGKADGPPAKALAAERRALEFRPVPMKNGARLVIIAKTPRAKAALHAFLRHQRDAASAR